MQDNPETGTTVEYTVDDAAAGGRLDSVLATFHPVLSRSRIKDLILSGAASIDRVTILEPKHKVKSGDRLILTTPPPEDPAPAGEDIPLDILYEDEALIVIDKPAGLVVHPAPGSPSGTLVNALIHYCGADLKGIGGVRRPGIVHRLDKDTSGVMVVAKTAAALNHLAAQFADHGRSGPLRRAYTAFAWGKPQSHIGAVDAPLGRDAQNRLKQAVRKDGRTAITHYAIQAHFAGEGWAISRLECRLETGRTHQIRVHMAHIDHPLLADPLYATGYATKANRLPDDVRDIVKGLSRQALHAAELGFAHPVSGKEMLFRAALPGDLAKLDAGLTRYDKTHGNR